MTRPDETPRLGSTVDGSAAVSPPSLARPRAAADQVATDVSPADSVPASTAASLAASAAVLTHQAVAESLAAVDIGQWGPAPGGPAGGGPLTDADRPGAPSGRMAGLRIGSHRASRAALTPLSSTSPGVGLVVGADQNQRPVSVRFFRPEPTRVAVVGGVWIGQLVVFRALALGAHAVVVTNDPVSWQGFGERSTGRTDVVTVTTTGPPPPLIGLPDRPVLVIYDLGPDAMPASLALGPWQTQLTVVRRLERAAIGVLQDCHLAMLQRLAGEETGLAGDAFDLPPAVAGGLQLLENDVTALVGGGTNRYLWLCQTELEQRLLGPARR
jgi:hypothetical protein